MGFEKLSAMLGGISSGGTKSLVRVEGYHDRGGIPASSGSRSRWRFNSLHQHRREANKR